MENRIKKKDKVNAPNVVTYFANLLTERPLTCPHCGCVSTLKGIALAILFSFSWLQLKCYRAIATLHFQILGLSSCINALQRTGASYFQNNEFSAKPFLCGRFQFSKISIYLWWQTGVAQSVQLLEYGLFGQRFKSPQKQEIFLFSTPSRPAAGPTKLDAPWVQGVVSQSKVARA